MKLIFNILFTSFIFSGYSQDTIFLNSEYQEISKGSFHTYFKILDKINNDTVEKIYYSNGNIKSEDIYSNYSSGIKNGISKIWHNNGTIKAEINYKQGNYHGSFKTYWSNGKLKRSDIYDSGRFIDGNCYDSTGMAVKHFDYAIYPIFPGGPDNLMKYIAKNCKYPMEAQDEGITGEVLVKFVIRKDGTHQAYIFRGVHYLLDHEALNVVNSMPRWTSGYCDGEPVNVWYVIPVKFNMK
jgi:TonB family protein